MTSLRRSGRMNFVTRESFDLSQPVLESHFQTDRPTHSWFVFVKEKALTDSTQHQVRSLISVEKMRSDEISVFDRRKIVDAWKAQYVDHVQAGRSSEQRKELEESIHETLSEGTHLLYKEGKRLVGHGNYVEDVNSALKLENFYLHLWTNQECASSVRKLVLEHFFKETEALNSPLTAGIAINNLKSIAVFIRAKFAPKMLSVMQE